MIENFLAAPSVVPAPQREEQAEQRGNDTEHLRGDFGVEPLADCRQKTSNQLDERQHDSRDRCDHGEHQEADRYIVDDVSQHRQDQIPVVATTRPDASASRRER